MKRKTFLTVLIGAIAVLSSISPWTVNANGSLTVAQTKVQKKSKIGMKKARTIALAKAAGKIEGAELENENGKTIYSFDIRNDKGTITEVQVEAYTGEIVSVEEENAQKEAAEKKEDEKKPHKKTN